MDFNQSCAEGVYSRIAKMDDGEAQMFALFLADELWRADMRGNRSLVEKAKKQIDEGVTAKTAEALLAHLEAGGDPEEAVAVAASVAIAKADTDWWKFQERDRRGRFGRMTRSEYKARIKEVKAQAKADELGMRAALKHERARDPEFARAHRYFNNVDAYKAGRRGGKEVVDRTRTFQESWNKAPSAESGATTAFNRLQAGGQTVQAIGAATGSPKLAVAGAAANYAGQFGPEAEKVVGPATRRAAYRYRGTERKPDRNLSRLVEAQAAGVHREQGRDYGTTTRVINGKTVKVPNKTAVEGLTPAEKSYAAERAAVHYFMGGYKDGDEKGKSRLPSPGLAELHRKSGRITPSEGVIIDAQGNVVSQSVGFGEDHYLPFNLKNLSALKGGSYVRTRESGGLTTEDIYTGLMSGARSMTVVSHSGVFTLDFDDALRGGRRYSDKARAMVDRYQATLDAVQSEQVRRMPISAREKAEVREQVMSEVEAQGLQPWEYTPEMVDRYVNQKLLERRSNPVLNSQEYEEIERSSWQGLNRNRPSDQDMAQQRRVFRQLERQKLQAKGQPNYKLDGEGYKAALDALKEQFPYFVDDVKVSANRDDPENFTDKVDLGYVKPRFVRPTAASVGFYGEGVGIPKRSAEETGYQNWGVRRNGTVRPVAREESAGQNTPSAEERVVAPGQAKAEASYQEGVKAAEAQRDQTALHAAKWWHEGLAAGGGNPYPQAAVLNRLASLPPEQQMEFVRENSESIRNAVSFLESKHPDVAASAPKIRYSPPERPREAPTQLGQLKPVDILEKAEMVSPGIKAKLARMNEEELHTAIRTFEQKYQDDPELRDGWSWKHSADAVRAALAQRHQVGVATT